MRSGGGGGGGSLFLNPQPAPASQRSPNCVDESAVVV